VLLRGVTWLGTDVSKLHIGLITQQTEELGYLFTRSIGMKQTRKMYNFGVRLFVVSKQFYAACTKGSLSMAMRLQLVLGF
jgi:hypothetical protein